MDSGFSFSGFDKRIRQGFFFFIFLAALTLVITYVEMVEHRWKIYGIGVTLILEILICQFILQEYRRKKVVEPWMKDFAKTLASSFPLRKQKGTILVISQEEKIKTTLQEKYPKANIHWRKSLSFKEGEVFDGILCHYAFSRFLKGKEGRKKVLETLDHLPDYGVFVFHDFFMKPSKNWVDGLKHQGVRKAELKKSSIPKKVLKTLPLQGSAILMGIK